MARKAKAEQSALEPLALISRLLALNLVKGMDKDEAVIQLGGAGFDDATVSQLLSVPESTIRGVRFRRNKKPKKKSKG